MHQLVKSISRTRENIVVDSGDSNDDSLFYNIRIFNDLLCSTHSRLGSEGMHRTPFLLPREWFPLWTSNHPRRCCIPCGLLVSEEGLRDQKEGPTTIFFFKRIGKQTKFETNVSKAFATFSKLLCVIQTNVSSNDAIVRTSAQARVARDRRSRRCAISHKCLSRNQLTGNDRNGD